MLYFHIERGIEMDVNKYIGESIRKFTAEELVKIAIAYDLDLNKIKELV